MICYYRSLLADVQSTKYNGGLVQYKNGAALTRCDISRTSRRLVTSRAAAIHS